MSSPSDAAWRPMMPADLSSVAALADLIHADYPEDGAVLAEKLRLFPDGCLSLDSRGTVIGYCYSHPWTKGTVPALNTRLHALPAAPTTYFIHDVAVHPGWRGRGLAQATGPLLSAIGRRARLTHLSLVSVHGSQAFWQRLGFSEAADAALRRTVREAYGDGAVPMEQTIGRALDTGRDRLTPDQP